jgi:hypothetical protein
MSPRFELLTALPVGNEASRITTQFKVISFIVQISFDQPLNRSITFDGLVLHAFALNPGCTPELEAKLAPGIYRIHGSPWLRIFKYEHYLLKSAPEPQHFLFLLQNGMRFDVVTSKATITDNASTIEVPSINKQESTQIVDLVRLASRCERCVSLPSLSYEPADDVWVGFHVIDMSTLEACAENEFTSERQEVRFIGTSSFIYYWGQIQSERPCKVDFAEMIGCTPSQDAGIFANHHPGLRSFYFGLSRSSFLEVASRDYAITFQGESTD